MINVTCFKCGYNHQQIGKLPRTETCPKCGEDLHCCKNCTFYDPSVANECREPVADYVKYKDRANFCDYFEPRAATPTGDKVSKTQEDARKAWEKLFKN